jgi:cell division protein FtsW (lipid II flippase)
MVTATKDNPLPDYIAAVIILLMAVGTVFVFSASANINQHLDLQKFYEFTALRQVLFFPIDCVNP